MDSKIDEIKIFEHFGQEAQIEKLREEVEEFIEAIQTGTKKEQTEEAADVMLVLNQFCEVKNLSAGQMLIIMSQKKDRTLERIESGYYEEEKHEQ